MLNITIYQSNGEEELFVKKDKAQLTPVTTGAAKHKVVIDEEQTFQEMDGFGASFTDSAAYLIHQVLETEQRSELMTQLFDPNEGIGLSVLRQPMGHRITRVTSTAIMICLRARRMRSWSSSPLRMTRRILFLS